MATSTPALLTGMAVLALLCAAPPPASARLHRLLVTDARDQFLGAHNDARAAVGVPPLQWSLALAAEAMNVTARQQQRGRCGFAGEGAARRGMNQGWSSGGETCAADAVASWVAERAYYDYAGNSCARGHDCGTYTQVVWRSTAELGCAQAACGGDGGGGGDTLSICLYKPHGNVEGQRPY